MHAGPSARQLEKEQSLFLELSLGGLSAPAPAVGGSSHRAVQVFVSSSYPVFVLCVSQPVTLLGLILKNPGTEASFVSDILAGLMESRSYVESSLTHGWTEGADWVYEAVTGCGILTLCPLASFLSQLSRRNYVIVICILEIYCVLESSF